MALRRAKSGSVEFSATQVLQYQHLERAIAGLRAELQRQLLSANVHETPVWETFEVTGPHPFTVRGRVWFEYRGHVESRSPFDREADAEARPA